MIKNKAARRTRRPRPTRKQWRRTLLWTVLAIAVAAPVAVLDSGAWLGARADGHIYGVDDVPDAPVVFAWLRAFRERLANLKAVADVVTRPDPVFLGPRETGVDDALTTP